MSLTAFDRDSSCRADESLVLATFGGHPITVDNVIYKAWQRSLIRPQPVTDPVLVGELLDDVILDSLIWRESQKINFLADYSFWAQVRRGLTLAASDVYGQEVVAPKLTSDSAQIEAYYRGHIGRYMVPHAQRYVRNITIYFPMEKIPKTYAKGDSVYGGWNPQAVIEALYARLADGEDFAALAKAHSEQPQTNARGGDLGWVSKESLPEDIFGQSCLRIPLYQISKPFQSRVGWHIVQVTGIREPGPAPIDVAIRQDIKSMLTDSIAQDLARRLLDSLVKAGTMEIFDKTLERPDSVWRPNTPLAVANGRDTILAAEYLDDIAGLRVRGRPVPSTLDEKREFIQGKLPTLCMHAALRDMGYLDRPEVVRRRDEMIAGRAESILRAKLVDASYVPDDAEVSRYFREHSAEFARPQSYMIRCLQHLNHDRAQALASAWKAGAVPDSMDTRWVSKGDVPASVWKTLTEMSEGSVSGPVASDSTYWVFTLVQKSALRTLADAAQGIRTKLQETHTREVRDSWMKQTSQKYGVARYPERFGQITLPSSKSYEPPAHPGANQEKSPAGG